MGTYRGVVDNSGRLLIYYRGEFVNEIKSLTGKSVEISIREKRKPVGKGLRGYIHACVVPELREAFMNVGYRYSEKQVYEFIKSNFLCHEIPSKHGEVIKVPMDLSELGDTDSKDVIRGLEHLKQWAAENLDHYIPDPGEQKRAF